MMLVSFENGGECVVGACAHWMSCMALSMLFGEDFGEVYGAVIEDVDGGCVFVCVGVCYVVIVF